MFAGLAGGATEVGVTEAGVAGAGANGAGATGPGSSAGEVGATEAGRCDWNMGKTRLKSAADADQVTRYAIAAANAGFNTIGSFLVVALGWMLAFYSLFSQYLIVCASRLLNVLCHTVLT